MQLPTDWHHRITPARVYGLEPGHVFVFSSNLKGIHGAGAALLARRSFGAVSGVGSGPTGSCYALPTKATPREPLPVADVARHVEAFTIHAGCHSGRFLVTEVGCGLAGLRAAQVAPMFARAALLPNVWLPMSFWQNLAEHGRHKESATTYRDGSCLDHDGADCEAHDRSGASALLVGERYNTEAARHAVAWPGIYERHPYLGLTRSGAFLWGAGRGRLLGLGVRWLRAANLLWPAPIGEWDAAEAVRWAGLLLADPATRQHRVVWVVGDRPARALGLDGGLLSRLRAGRQVFAVLPHPSGRSHLWNDPAYPAEVRRFVAETYERASRLGGCP